MSSLFSFDSTFIYTYRIANSKIISPICLRRLNITGFILNRAVTGLANSVMHTGIVLGLLETNDNFLDRLYVCEFSSSGFNILPYSLFSCGFVVDILPLQGGQSSCEILERLSKAINAPDFLTQKYNLCWNNCQTFVNKIIFGSLVLSPFILIIIGIILILMCR
jgi:hypothetical protein